MLIQTITAIEQSCKFTHQLNNKFVKDDGSEKYFYRCELAKVELVNVEEDFTINTSNNKKTNDDVEIVYLSGNVRFIPNSLYSIFPKFEKLEVVNAQLEVVIPSYFKNATNLKTLYIYGNNVTELGPLLFAEAENLEHISLESNEIMTVHKNTFKGLQKVEGIYLNHNKIVSLHPMSFRYLKTLQTLNLLKNTCISKRFNNASEEVEKIEMMIAVECTFDMTMSESMENLDGEMMNTEKPEEEKQDPTMRLEELLDELQTTISNFTARYMEIADELASKRAPVDTWKNITVDCKNRPIKAVQAALDAKVNKNKMMMMKGKPKKP